VGLPVAGFLALSGIALLIVTTVSHANNVGGQRRQ
jgi:hypothetical protein